MKTALYLLVVVGILGALDTLYYHEWILRLPQQRSARKELRLHAVRDFVYAVLFASMGWLVWKGGWVWVLALLLLFEVVLTLSDFLEEDRTRKLPAGERVMHAVIGIVYGAFLAVAFPHLVAWFRQPAGFQQMDYGSVSWILSVFAIGVLLSGIRDWVASNKLSLA